MGLRIGTNVQALSAQRHLSATNDSQRASLEKLSSGSRITKSADDAAGLAISEKMRAQVRSLRQDARNAGDGISMIQTAEGGMNEVQNILVRFRELSIQASSDTVGDTERKFIDKEVQSLKSEVQRIADSTEFNGAKLLNGEGKQFEFQIGTGNNAAQDRFSYDTTKVNSTLDGLGLSGVSAMDKGSAQNSLAVIDNAINKIGENRSELGALQNRLQSATNNIHVYDENLSAARSRIADVDVATETSELTKQNILSQAGVSGLSQANQNSQMALKLIG